jgi:diadenosine tetraphosphate (Ap4A) HIT family hydrolase
MNPNTSRIEQTLNCCFCNELICGIMPKEFIMQSGQNCRFIMLDPDFTAMPSISPLAIGHVLIIPKSHVTSLAQLSPDLIKKFVQFKKAVVGKIEAKFGTTLCWEHGVGLGRTGGCGVTHAHMHVLPLYEEGIYQIHNKLRISVSPKILIEGFQAINTVIHRTDTYLYWELTKQRQFFVSIGEHIPSQLIRRMAADIQGVPEWNWRELYSWDLFNSTLESLGISG